MTILFAASVPLWIKYRVAQLFSMALCALALSITVEHLNFGWEQFVMLTKYWFAESCITGVVWFVWKEIAVSLFSLLLFCYGVILLRRAWMRQSRA
jgi:hypothetical protein